MLSNLLTYPFDHEILPWPQAGQRTLIYNAQYWDGTSDLGAFDVVQDFHTESSQWSAYGVESTPEIKQECVYDVVLCALPKQKEASFYQLAMSINTLSENGLLIAVAANDAGGKRLEKWFKDLELNPSSASKSKCRIVWAYKNDVDASIIDKFIANGAKQVKDIEGLKIITQPGIFGWDKIDKGSRLLTKNIPNDLRGVGADFGCGYGFLTKFVLDNCKKIKHMYAIDADYNGLSCAKKNLKNYEQVEYQWADLTLPVKFKQPLDFIVMNPPFHDGKKTSSDIGQKFIENSYNCLRRNGALYMVANAHLPYEKLLEKLFFSAEKITEEQGFKIYKAVK